MNGTDSKEAEEDWEDESEDESSEEEFGKRNSGAKKIDDKELF